MIPINGDFKIENEILLLKNPIFGTENECVTVKSGKFERYNK